MCDEGRKFGEWSLYRNEELESKVRIQLSEQSYRLMKNLIMECDTPTEITKELMLVEKTEQRMSLFDSILRLQS